MNSENIVIEEVEVISEQFYFVFTTGIGCNSFGVISGFGCPVGIGSGIGCAGIFSGFGCAGIVAVFGSIGFIGGVGCKVRTGGFHCIAKIGGFVCGTNLEELNKVREGLCYESSLGLLCY